MRNNTLASSLAFIVATVLLAACSGLSSNAIGTPVAPAFERSGAEGGSIAKASAENAGVPASEPPRRAAQFIYVSDSVSNVVNVFTKSSPYGKVRAITDDVDTPRGLALDANGNLFVTDQNKVEEYHRGGSAPIFAYSKDLSDLSAAAVDSAGNVYVCDNGDDEVAVFPRRKNNPSRFISLPGTPLAVAIDSHDNLYVDWTETSYGTRIYEYASGSKNPKDLHLNVGGKVSEGIAVDSYGNIALSTQDPGQLALYPSGSQNATVTVSYPYSVYNVALDRQQNKLYLAGGYNTAETVQIFDYNAKSLRIKSIGSVPCEEDCWGVAVGS